MRTSIFFWLLLVAVYTNILFGHWSFVSAQCLSDQQSLLLSLKNGLVFKANLSTKLAEWNPGSNYWPGVTCENGQVTGLDLGNESISDGINSTSSLFRLQHLKRLNLAFNMLSSKELPPQIGNLSSLEYLNLSNAGLVGQIPLQMSNLTRLTTLDLSMLYFPGTNSLKLMNPDLKTLIAGLDQLRELYLDGVNVSAPGHEWCGALSTSLPKLQVLSMVNCYLSGPIDPSLANLKSLSVIRLGNNNLSTEVPDFLANFSNLTILHMSTAGLFGIFPEKIFQVPTLQNLDVSYNSLLQGSFPEFPMGTSLRTVAVSFTNFSGQLPHSTGTLGNLSRMELVNCSFRGQIPSSMAELSKLVYLDFSFNDFIGLVPSFSNSRNLTTLILSHNSLKGEINSTLWEFLKNLEIVDLRYNLLDGSIPSSLFAIPRIQKIQLSSNRFLGSVLLEETLNFSSYVLDTVDLGNNDLSGPIPTALFRYPQLKYLSLSCNNFSGSMDINEVQKVSVLSYLDLSYNNLSIIASGAAAANSSFPQLSTAKLASCHLKTMPGFLSNQSKLVVLDLSDNEMHGAIPNWIWSLNNLLNLNLSQNLFEDVESQNLGYSMLSVLDLHLNKLRGKLLPVPPFAAYVDYSRNQFNSVVPDDIGRSLFYTIFFSLSHNNLQGTIPESICRAGYLQVLDLSDNAFEGIIPPCIVDMTFLKVLNLRKNSLSGSVPEGFPKACNLKTLDFSENSLQGKIPQSLSNCTMLEVLDVGGNQMDGGFPCHLKNRTFIRVLVMRGNKFSGQIGCPGINRTWDTLQIVDLASNRFDRLPPTQALSTWKAMQENDDDDHLHLSFLGLTGLYYQDTVTVTVKGLSMELVKILKVFTSIDISDNMISGEIPSVVGTFQSLRLLNISGNKISGQIPPPFGNLTKLESMDLSRNQLTGPIPSELVHLNFLSILNVSYNQLSGRIPTGQQFSTFDSSSYLNNRGLCGTPLQSKCSSSGDNANATEPVQGVVHLDWQLIVTGLGFGTGAAVAVAQLTMWTACQQWYDERIDRFLLVFLPILGFTYTIWDEEESEDGGEDRSPEESQFDLEEEETWGRYCVFCSKLDQNLKKVIHELNCTCYDSPYNSSSSVSSSYSSSSFSS